jgi:hypothetical protein
MFAQLQAVGRDRVVTVRSTQVTVARRLWWRIINDSRPGAVTIPAGHVRKVGWREPQWWRAGRLLINAPGHNDPWRRTIFGGRPPHRVRFGQRRRDDFARIFNTLSEAL